jgi:hypothetical protein
MRFTIWRSSDERVIAASDTLDQAIEKAQRLADEQGEFCEVYAGNRKVITLVPKRQAGF